MLENNKISPITDLERLSIIGLTLEIPGFDFTKYFYPKKKSIIWIPSDNGFLNIRLIDDKLIEEFGDFYKIIIERLDLSFSDEQILLSLKHLFRQKEKLFKSATEVTHQEAMGLFGELIFLKEMLYNSDNHELTLEGWRRPDRSTHDFDYGQIGFEIKATGLTTKTIKIQNENQLDRLNHDVLYLICYRVECFPSTKINSIRDLATDISFLLNSPILEDQLFEKIGKDIDEYKFDIIPQFKIINEVNDTFPKITTKDLNGNLSSVKYEVSMSYIEQNGKKSKMAE
jgi:hypothetical protein